MVSTGNPVRRNEEETELDSSRSLTFACSLVSMTAAGVCEIERLFRLIRGRRMDGGTMGNEAFGGGKTKQRS